ncbi:MAG: aldehyde dehydrogenase family protein [Oligoflexales bacterium]|nr:aldehyde dehydrogenase family protein [Oligoflexales bacterium]
MQFTNFSKALADRNFPMEFPGHFIDGEWIKSPRTAEPKTTFNPSTGLKILETSLDRATIDHAVNSLISREQEIGSLTFDERITLIEKFKRSLCEYKNLAIQAMEIGTGKPHWEAQSDFDSAVDYLNQLLEQRDFLEETIISAYGKTGSCKNIILTPIGATAAYLPLFTPSVSFVQYLSATILAGCPLLLVSSAHGTLSGLLFAYLAQISEFPNGLLNVIYGSFSALLQTSKDKRIKAIIYKGSREHSETIRKESYMIAGRQLILQSGGKNSVIVDHSAKIDQAVQFVFWGALKNAGQLCSSTSRVLIPSSQKQEFLDALFSALKNMTIGPTDKEGDNPDMGPLYSKKAVDKFLKFQTMAQREAEYTLYRGKIYETAKGGFFVTPAVHLMKKMDNTTAYQSNVLMFPDIAVYTYETLENAIADANNTDSPYIVSFIGQRETIEPLRKKIMAPNLLINLPTTELEANMPINGKLYCGGHRLTGTGLLFFLTYPQAMLTSDVIMGDFKTWPKSKN